MTRNDNALDSAWESDFIVELRLRDVDGHAIGDALEQVRSHCAESGQSAREAFGDPVAYARTLDLPAEPLGLGVVIARSVAAIASMFLTLWGFTAWLDGEGFTLTLGHVAVVALLVGAVLMLPRLLSVIVRHPWWSGLVMGAVVAGTVVVQVLLTQPLVVLPTPVVMAVGAAGLLATSLWEVLSADADADPVVSPVTGREDEDTRAGRIMAALTPWLLPLATVVLMVLLAVLDRLT
ncbi:hypothetical protein [Georgenia faecalis]|uniref:DUF1129 family protein n=1 Tax=Georgenia faecalis TaxID=2483799 RepID=A0ABV9DDV3_9MICO|nr:hypothetical protein [Georgenia faecalis]